MKRDDNNPQGRRNITVPAAEAEQQPLQKNNPPAPPVQNAQAQEASASVQQPIGNIAYKISGAELQTLQISLKPSQSIIAEGDTLMYYDNAIEMKVKMSGASVARKKGLLAKLKGISKAVMYGEKIFMMNFTNPTQDNKVVTFTTSHPGCIVAINLAKYGGRILCQKNSFICAEHGIKISTATQKDLGGGLIRSSLNMQVIEGQGMVFVYFGGSVIEKNLLEGEVVNTVSGITAAMTANVRHQDKTIKNVGVTGESYKVSQLVGPGVVWLQSLPFNKIQKNISDYIAAKYSLVAKKK